MCPGGLTDPPHARYSICSLTLPPSFKSRAPRLFQALSMGTIGLSQASHRSVSFYGVHTKSHGLWLPWLLCFGCGTQRGHLKRKLLMFWQWNKGTRGSALGLCYRASHCFSLLPLFSFFLFLLLLEDRVFAPVFCWLFLCFVVSILSVSLWKNALFLHWINLFLVSVGALFQCFSSKVDILQHDYKRCTFPVVHRIRYS